MKTIRASLRVLVPMFAAVLLSPLPAPAATSAVLGWNNLGMHCMDSDYSVFSILPPYNTIEAQLVVNGRLVTNGAGYTITYQAVADPAGSFNSTAMGKGNFYTFSADLYGAALAPEMGLAGWAMPGTNNTPQATLFEPTNHPATGVATPVNWFRAEGIPTAPYDDAHVKNTYPLLRLVARDAGNNVLATSAIVLPVSDEMDCRACHGTGTQAAAQPAAGWASDPNPEREYRLNILRLHDERQFALNPALYTAALAARGFNPAGLYTNVIADAKPVLCAKCHASEALGTASYGTIPPLTASVHSHHAGVMDPVLNVTLDNSANRAACYRCHPGSTTRCLRGAMGSAIAADGSMAMQCQSCHGNMSAVGSNNRVGWFMEPACQSCHSGTATHNNGQIRYTSVFEPNGAVRAAVDQTFATTPDTPAAGLSLFRFSYGHGGLQCEACHGSTHAEFPSSHVNDNLRDIQLQGHAGVLAECTACHTAMPSTVTGGPHGMHPTGQTWVNQHHDLFENGAASKTQCQACHGSDYRGTVLSRAQADRQLVGGSDNGTVAVQLFRGAIVGCYNCHNGPNSDSMNNNPAPTVGNVSAVTAPGQAVAMTLPATGANLTLRIISQPAHGSVGLSGRVATYFPQSGFVGTDTFTFAAYDGAKNSTLGTGSIGVGAAVDKVAPTIRITAPTVNPTYAATSPDFAIRGTAADNIAVVSVTWANSAGGSGVAVGTNNWMVAGIALQPGLNVITVTARDAANNAGTDTLTVTYTPTGSITVSTNGFGTVSPNLNGQHLPLGKIYTLTARAGAGYLFSHWSGSLVATTPTISFVLLSNTVLAANFVDAARPRLAITNLVNYQQWGYSSVPIKGWASDNVQVAAVQYRLEDGSWFTADGTNKWSGIISGLAPGKTNTLSAYAQDVTGNYSLTSVVKVVYNQFLPVNGTYNGLFSASNALHSASNRTHESSGFLKLTVSGKGTYSGYFVLAGKTHSLGSGRFDGNGHATKTNLLSATNSVVVDLALNLEPGSDTLTGTLSNSQWVADLRADRAVFTTTKKAPYAGRFTLGFPGALDQNDTTAPVGLGYAAVTVYSLGNVILSGSLADGAALSQGTMVSKDGWCPFYCWLYGTKGSVWGWLQFTNQPPADLLGGEVSWIKQAQPTAKYYPLGFTNILETQGSLYVAPSNTTTRVIGLTNGIVSFVGGNLGGPFTNQVVLMANNHVTNASPNRLTLSLGLANGTFSGTVVVPGTKTTTSFKGAMLQDENVGWGYFLGASQSGRACFSPIP